MKNHAARLQGHIAGRHEYLTGSGNEAQAESQQRGRLPASRWARGVRSARAGASRRVGVASPGGTTAGDGVDAESNQAAVDPLAQRGGLSGGGGGRELLGLRGLVGGAHGSAPREGEDHRHQRCQPSGSGNQGHLHDVALCWPSPHTATTDSAHDGTAVVPLSQSAAEQMQTRVSADKQHF